MKRNEWKFSYPADKLHDAAVEKINFHTGRLKWWTDKQNEIMKKIKDEGIEIDQSVAFDPGHLHYATTNVGRGPVATIRNDLLKDLNETTSKITEHRAKIEQYRGWEQVMKSQGQASFELHHDDWLFFFGK